MGSSDTKFIFLTGGGAGSLGKGVISASIGMLLKARGLKVSIQRFDPFFNVDKRMIDTSIHGEIFVTDDGSEVSFHLGDYERFLNESLNADNYITAGQIYYSIIMKERRNGFGGHIVRMFPDVIQEIKSRLRRLADSKKPDVLLTEIGGSINDIEILPFLETARQLRSEQKPENVMFVHVALVPYIKVSKKYETRTAYQIIRELRSWGIEPDIIIARSESLLPPECKEELLLYSSFRQDAIFEAIDVESIYEVPIVLHRQGADRLIASLLGLKSGDPDLAEWNLFLQRMKSPLKLVEIAVCGPNVHNRNSYRSLAEALEHAAVANNIRVKMHCIDTGAVTSTEQLDEIFQSCHGIILIGDKIGPSLDGEMRIAEYARLKQKPFIGIDIGCHALIIEFARNVCKLKTADTQEMNESTRVPVIHLLCSPNANARSTPSMCLGSYPLVLLENSLASQIYGKREIAERFRGYYGLNNKYIKVLEKRGLVASGRSSNKKRFEIVELKGHPFYVGTQFHPEFKSRPLAPHPLFYHFLKKTFKHSEVSSKP